MPKDEFDIKIEICQYLGIKPVFAVRQLPKDWINQLYKQGGFALILKYQFFPPIITEQARKFARELRFPIDVPRDLENGTMLRFLNNYHNKHL